MLLAALLLMFAGDSARADDWCDEPICARMEGTDLIRILIPDQLEIEFTRVADRRHPDLRADA